MWQRKLLIYFLYGCIGITGEIFFTAFSDVVNSLQTVAPINWDLKGKSYVWMLFIYGLTAVLFPLGYRFLVRFPLLFRLFAYAIVIFAVEFLTGWLLEITTGHCPWHYTTSLAIMGYIRLDYLPGWMAFGFLLETLHKQFTALLGKY